MINPGLQDPRNHIHFQDDAPVALDDIGQTTIIVLGLRRTDLQEARLEQLNKIKMSFRIAYLKALAAFFDQDEELKQKSISEFEQFIEEMRRADAKFSSMAQDLINQLLKEVEVFGQTLTKFNPQQN